MYFYFKLIKHTLPLFILIYKKQSALNFPVQFALMIIKEEHLNKQEFNSYSLHVQTSNETKQ